MVERHFGSVFEGGTAGNIDKQPRSLKPAPARLARPRIATGEKSRIAEGGDSSFTI
jgi:hypothetical protein